MLRQIEATGRRKRKGEKEIVQGEKSVSLAFSLSPFVFAGLYNKHIGKRIRLTWNKFLCRAVLKGCYVSELEENEGEKNSMTRSRRLCTFSFSCRLFSRFQERASSVLGV